MSSRLRIDRIDVGPGDLASQLPVEAQLLRQLRVPEHPDYFFAVLEQALIYETSLTALEKLGVDPDAADPRLISIGDDGSVFLRVFGIAFAARNAGELPHVGMKDFPVSLAYVVDNTALKDETLDFRKLIHVAVARLTDIDAETPAA
ncbi:hypothetical protein [Microbacterium sp.]|uniref:hypothetical protein n=1 Tax=Microbacterium sp. TaxID=51671 RepID=UPI003C71BE64